MDAFISYSHGQDNRIASALEQGLKRFAAPFHRLKPALKVFRDQTDLSASPSLWNSIEMHIQNARYLVLLASPSSAQSEWVRREVTSFLSHHDTSALIIVLTDGEICWDSHSKDFDWTATTSLPQDMSDVFEDEPLFVDLRWASDVDQTLSLDNERFGDDIATIAATIHGKPKATLFGEQARQRRRSLILGWTSSLVLLLLLIGIGIFAIYAIIQRDIARSRELAALSDIKLSISTRRSAEIALEAIKIRPTREAISALRKAVLGPLPRVTVDNVKSIAISADEAHALVFQQDDTAILFDLETGQKLRSFSMTSLGFIIGDAFQSMCGSAPTDTESYFAVSSDLRWLAVASPNQDVFIVDMASGGILFEHRKDLTETSGQPHSFVVRKIRDRGFKIFDHEHTIEPINLYRSSGTRTATNRKSISKVISHVQGVVLTVIASSDRTRYLVGREDGVASLHDAESGKLEKTLVSDGGRICGGGFSADGETLITSSMKGKAFVWNTASGEKLAQLNDNAGSVMDSYFSPGGHFAVSHHASEKRINIWPAHWRSRWVVKHPRGFPFENGRFIENGTALLLKSRNHYFRWTTADNIFHEVGADEWLPSMTDKNGVQGTLCPGAVAFNPTTTMQAAIFKGDAKLCDHSTGTTRTIKAPDGRFASVSFSPDGEFLITSIESGKGSKAPLHYAGIWEIATGDLWYRLTGHHNWLRSAEFSPDGSNVVTTSADGSARIFITPAFISTTDLINNVTQRLDYPAN